MNNRDHIFYYISHIEGGADNNSLFSAELLKEEMDRYSPRALLITFSNHRHPKPHFDYFQLGTLSPIT